LLGGGVVVGEADFTDEGCAVERDRAFLAFEKRHFSNSSYTSAPCNFGSRHKLNAATVIRNC